MASVAMIYFARLSMVALSHKQKLPAEFSRYNIPKWWGIYRHAGGRYGMSMSEIRWDIPWGIPWDICDIMGHPIGKM